MTPDRAMTPDEKLKALLGASRPAVSDRVFVLAVAERVARRRLVLSLMALLPWALVAGLVALFLLPALGTFGHETLRLAEDLGPVVGLSVVTLLGAALLVRRFRPA